MRLKLYGKDDVKLPLDLNTEDRMALSDKIIKENPESFELTGHSKADFKVKVRLDILGTYILNSVPNIREDVMSRYKQNVRPYQEKSISNFNTKNEQNLNNALFADNSSEYYGC